jgi:hypothetical protein
LVEVFPGTLKSGPGSFGEEEVFVGLLGFACDDFSRRVVDFPLEGGLGEDRSTCLTDILSTKMERRKLKRRGTEMLDSFLLRRYTFEYFDMPGQLIYYPPASSGALTPKCF